MAEEPTTTPVEEEPKVIEDPVHDPVALGSAFPISGGGKLLEVLMDEMPESREGVEVPDLETMTGAQQNHVEVLTGKRLQKPAPVEEPPPPAPPA